MIVVDSSVLMAFFRGHQNPANPAQTYRNAARIYYDCRRRGLTLRSTVDCFIGQLVLEIDGTLLHNDGDFESIAEVRPLQILRS